MREMILNHASVLAPGSNRHSISTWLKDVAVGMRHLVSEGVVHMLSASRSNPSSKRSKDVVAERRFRSHLGVRELFEWHARFGNSGRIHLRWDPKSREVEIGYIGNHLPLE